MFNKLDGIYNGPKHLKFVAAGTTFKKANEADVASVLEIYLCHKIILFYVKQMVIEKKVRGVNTKI